MGEVGQCAGETLWEETCVAFLNECAIRSKGAEQCGDFFRRVVIKDESVFAVVDHVAAIFAGDHRGACTQRFELGQREAVRDGWKNEDIGTSVNVPDVGIPHGSGLRDVRKILPE